LIEADFGEINTVFFFNHHNHVHGVHRARRPLRTSESLSENGCVSLL
jgi:hypothetical protein